MNLRQLVELVSSLRPGEQIEIDTFEFEVPTLEEFTPPDRVLENIVGSAYEFRYHKPPMRRVIVFERLPKPLENDLYSYVSPDRLEWYRKRIDGLYELDPTARR